MKSYLEKIKEINTVEGAIACLADTIEITPLISKAIQFCIEAHKDQFRKSGEPYVVHPILVASITAYFSYDNAMVLAALLHDVVEDTNHTAQEIEDLFGSDVSHIVEGLTKITEIRESKILSSDDKLTKSALTFRKMLIASIDDVRVLVVKLFDRTHNMLTLDALPKDKQKRISDETLVVYAPIAHRLGMSNIKNILEDLSFFYLYPNEYRKIDKHINKYQEKTELIFDVFLEELKKNIIVNEDSDIDIFSRVKHYYSIYLKIQRKGISIDEVLDLFAIRIITSNVDDCYKILGQIHTKYNPLISRFKDYIAIPKENGYQTIHTTVFNNAKIFEIQIRTKDMHDVAENGIAAHWKYKDGKSDAKGPNLAWLHTLEIDNNNINEFYNDAKQDLFSEEIIVYSPKGEILTMPREATALDFAYLIHTELGNKAISALINNVKKPLLSELKSGDVISVYANNETIARCSWYDMVKTTKAKKNIKILCLNKLNTINNMYAVNMLNTIFSRYKKNAIENMKLSNLSKATYNLDYLKNIKRTIENRIRKEDGLFARLKVQKIRFTEYKFENIVLQTNFAISSFGFDHCCHPKVNDDIIAFRNKKEVTIHHKMCETAYEKMQNNEQMIFCKWSEDKYYVYKMVVSLPSTRGELARLLMHLSDYEAVILSIEYGKDRHSYIQYCTIDFEIKNNSIEKVKRIVNQKAKVIEFYSGQDAYK